MPAFRVLFEGVAAAAHGQLGRRAEDQVSWAKVLALKPDFASSVRGEWRKWIWQEEAIEHYVDGLRKAGLEILDE